MTTFIVIAALMCFVAVAFVALPLWFGDKTGENAQLDRRETLLGILRQQAKDLEKELTDGTITADEYEEARSELQQRVLEETKTLAGDESVKSGWKGKALAGALIVAIPAIAGFSYMGFGEPKSMDIAYLAQLEADQQRTASGHTRAEMRQGIEELKERLKANPQDADGWFMLSRSYGELERYDEAAKALRELDKLVPNNPHIKADLADMIAAANGKHLNQEAKELLEEALRIDAHQWKALALLAIYAWDTEDYASAAHYWERLIEVMPADFGNPDTLRANIEEAKRRAAIQAGKMPAPEVSMGSEGIPTVKAVPVSFVAGRVTLDPKLTSKVQPDDVVFIYARPLGAQRMPVAYARMKAGDLPIEFRLTDEMQLATGIAKLSDIGEVIVGARISHSGNFMPQAGDLEGETAEPVKINSDNIAVTISHIR